MSEIVHDLLKEVEELETATKELEKTSSQADAHHQKLLDKKSVHQNNIQLLNLEAIKAAQDAATLSQQAAQASLNQGQKLKAEIFEISEANFNWRQAIRNATNEIKSAKSSMTIMLVISIVFSLSAAAAAGYFAYKLQKQNALLQGEIVDIVATEHGLLKKDITLKIDELASVIETMNYPQRNLTPTENSNTLIIDQKQPLTEQPENKPDFDTTSMTDNAANLAVDENKVNKVQTIDTPTLDSENKEKSQAVAENTNSALINTELENIKKEMVKLENAIASNQQLLQQINNHKNTNSNPATNNNISAKNSKKLDSLSWLIRQQSKKVNALEKSMSNLGNIKTTPAAKDLEAMRLTLENIQQQQKHLKNQMKAVDKSLAELTELSKEPPPYSYKAK